MKQTIDLMDPRVQYLSALAGMRSDMAYAATAKFEPAVRPIFVISGPRKTPVQVGSCVLVRIKDELFAFSASHVFEDVGGFQVPIGCGNQILYLSGERFSSARGASGSHRDDLIDTSVLHIQGDVPPAVWESALSIVNLDSFSASGTRSMHMAVGYRASKSHSVGKTLSSQLDFVPSFEYDDSIYETLRIDRASFTAIAYDDEVPMDGKWQTSPSPRGMSGGAMFRIQGVPVDPTVQPSATPEPKLASIITEFRRATGDKPPVLIGSRIGHHLGLIHSFLPGVLESSNIDPG